MKSTPQIQPNTATSAREDRLGSALRENLRKRKAQAETRRPAPESDKE